MTTYQESSGSIITFFVIAHRANRIFYRPCFLLILMYIRDFTQAWGRTSHYISTRLAITRTFISEQASCRILHITHRPQARRFTKVGPNQLAKLTGA